MLNAGDTWDRRQPSADEIASVERPLAEHRGQDGAPVISILGNHCRSGAGDVSMPEAVSLGGLMRVVSQPQTIAVGDTSVCCLPWTPVSRVLADREAGDRDEAFAEAAALLVDAARDLRRRAADPAVLLAHSSVSGSSLPSGLDAGSLREPVLPLSDLDAVGFGAVVLGHIHRPQQPHPGMFYVGSPMTLDHGEAGVPHGCWLLDTDRPHEPEFIPLPSRRWLTVDGDEDTARGDLDVRDAVVRARVTVGGADELRMLRPDQIHVRLLEAGAHCVTGKSEGGTPTPFFTMSKGHGGNASSSMKSMARPYRPG